MRGKKILIIARDFIPYYHSLGGVLRVFKMAKFFDAQGFEVFILAAKGEEISYFGYQKAIKNLNVNYIPDMLQYYNTRKYNQEKKKLDPSMISKTSLARKVKGFLIELSIPDLGIYFFQKFVREGIRIIEEYSIRNVIVSSPPHSTQLIGFKLKKRFQDRINLIVDYRDSWNTTGIFQKRCSIFKGFSERLEKRILKVSDHFVYHSPPVLNKINSKFVDITHKSLLVMNGFDSSIKLTAQRIFANNNEYLTIGHFGAIHEKANSFRNPKLFFEALLKLNQKIKVVFYGTTRINEIWQKRSKDMIEIKGTVSHEAAVQLMQEMDVLMLLHSEREGADEVIPAKLFEYILAEKPILVVGPENMEAARIVRNNGLGYTINLYDEDDILDKMNTIHDEWGRAALPRYKWQDFRKFSRDYQYSKLLGILE